MQAKGLPIYFWVEVVAMTVYILNLSTIRVVHNQTPYEAWTSKRTMVSHLKVFGCVAYGLVETYSRRFDEKSEKYIFVGYSSESKAYKPYNFISGKKTISKDVVFNEIVDWDGVDQQVQQNIPVELPSVKRQESPANSLISSPTLATPCSNGETSLQLPKINKR